MNYDMSSDEEILQDLARKIDKIRIEKRLKDIDVEAKSGISRQLLSDFRKGKRSISLKSFIRILRGIEELQRLESLFPNKKSYSPLGDVVEEQPKRVRTKYTDNKSFKWGDEK